MTEFLSPEELVARVPSGCKLGLAPDDNGASPAVARLLIERGIGNLHIVCAPIGGMQVDVLIGAGAVKTVETSAVSLGEIGGAPCFNRAVKSGAVRILDATCPAVFAGLVAAQKGIPFMPIRGIIGSDILENRPDWTIISNPFDKGDKLVAVSAIQPDISLIHAPEADRFGNVRLGRRRELMLLAYASKQTFVTVEKISDTSLLEDERLAAGVLPAMYVNAIAELKNGAWPTGLYAEYPPDNAEIARYAQLARSEQGLQEYLHGSRSAA
ncbi:MAG TPA: CoA-transferase [Rhodoblastus sp.]|nr:CoA-transferase [Rhodoblastus sp.]